MHYDREHDEVRRTNIQGTFRYDDDVDPLGILGNRSQDQRLNSAITGESELLQGVRPFELTSDHRRDPWGTIDAILKQSKDVRELVFSRQANVIDAYNNESRELDKELAFLPPTYQQFLAVRAKAASRRRQRSATLGRNNVRPHHSVSHPLNFHLTSDRDHSAAYLHFEDGNNEITVEAGGMKVWGEGFWVEHGQAAGVDCGCEEKTEGAGGHDDDNAGLAGRSPSKCDVSLEVATGSTKAGAYDDVGRGGVTDRRFSTRARHGSVTENAAATQAPQHEAKSWYGEGRRSRVQKAGDRVSDDIPALRRSKIRGRDMVFSLLEAARVEEEEMEKSVFGDSIAGGEEEAKQCEVTFQTLDDARVRNAREFQLLMAEYDSRPSNSRRERTLEKPRKDLPRPSHTAEGMPTTTKCGADRGPNRCTRPRTVSAQDFSTRDYCAYNAEADGVGGGGIGDVNDREREGEATGGNRSKYITEESVATGHGGMVDADVGDAVRVEHGGDGGRIEPRGQGRPVGVATDDKKIELANDNGERMDEVCREKILCTGVPTHPMPGSAPYAAVEGPVGERPVLCGGDDAGDDAAEQKQRKGGKDGPVSGETQKTSPWGRQRGTSPRKKPTLPDPNAINAAVMQDPFNMDHMKDLPGLIGGHSRELSLLVSEAVSYTDPAFPNLEFHRRMDMDRAGYFMPGYKPRVNSPGPDAGAYWLERRQSYRVKMTDSTISHQSDQHHQPNPTKARGNIKKGASKSRLTTRERTRTSSTGRKANHQGEGTQSSPADTSRMRMRKGPKATRGVGDPGSGPGRRNNCSGGDCRRGPSGGVGRGVGNSLRRETHAGTIVENG